MMYEYESNYKSEIKALANESYSFGGTDAFTEVWERLEAMKERGKRKKGIGKDCTSGYFYVIDELEKFVDAYFNWSASAHYHSARTDIVRGRMKNVDTEIERITASAVKNGILVPAHVVKEA